eukprot:TRINITY_DN114235_c0_g1_i1.p1 TRINITY_DN114235_c0_g1~~TRINITY_DN114235_c0_g1_i1.p1  ORF type:complete len:466 (+),score=99.67 TRINITY_DN114235_c0_g1_i1:46-1443(+)
MRSNLQVGQICCVSAVLALATTLLLSQRNLLPAGQVIFKEQVKSAAKSLAVAALPAATSFPQSPPAAPAVETTSPARPAETPREEALTTTASVSVAPASTAASSKDGSLDAVTTSEKSSIESSAPETTTQQKQNAPFAVYGIMTSNASTYMNRHRMQLETWAAKPLAEGRVFGVTLYGRIGELMPPYPSSGTLVTAQCGSDKSLHCKEAELIIHGIQRNAEWLAVLGDDNYVDTELLEPMLRAHHSATPMALVHPGCGKGQHFCRAMDVNEKGGICGGAGYYLNRAGQARLAALGFEKLREMYLRRMMPGDMASSCVFLNSGVRLSMAPWLDQSFPNRISARKEWKQIIFKRSKPTMLYHYVEASLAKWLHYSQMKRKGLPVPAAVDMEQLEAQAFDRGCSGKGGSIMSELGFQDCIRRGGGGRRLNAHPNEDEFDSLETAFVASYAAERNAQLLEWTLGEATLP